MLGTDAADQWQTLLDDPNRPLADRATRELYPPGSTFKTDRRHRGPRNRDSPRRRPPSLTPPSFLFPGSTATISNAGGGVCNNGESTTLLRAFVRSCNTTFARLAIEVGAEPIGDDRRRVGFNREIPFPWTVADSAFPTAELSDDPGGAWVKAASANETCRATPLQMALVAAAVANQGSVQDPYLVGRIFDAEGTEIEVIQPGPASQAFSVETAAIMSQMMERVVTEGTGRLAAVPGIRVAGKTGTATGEEGRPHAWFIGFGPVEQPSIAVAVFVESGGDVGESASGGSVAAPDCGPGDQRMAEPMTFVGGPAG